MNMQTQIDLFPVGMSYYSQILISLQIPPVSLASLTTPLQASTLAPRRLETKHGHGQKRGHPGFHSVLGPGLERQDACWAGRPVSCSPSNLWQQLTEPFCQVLDSSPRGTAAAAEAESRPCHTWEGKTSTIPTLTKPTAGL